MRLERTILLCQLAGGAESSIVDGLKDLLVQLGCFRAVECHAQQDERVCKALHFQDQ